MARAAGTVTADAPDDARHCRVGGYPRPPRHDRQVRGCPGPGQACLRGDDRPARRGSRIGLLFARHCLLLPAGAMAAGGAIEADAAPGEPVRLTVQQRERHYEVFAHGIEPLLSQLRVPGHQRGNGVHAHGLTATELQLSRETGRQGDQCRVERATLALSITVTTPRWKPDRAIPDQLATEWPRIRGVIEAHEDGHRQNALNAARWLRARIDTLRDWQPCSLLSAKLSRYVSASQTRQNLQDALLDSRAAARSELTRNIQRVRVQRQRPDWMQ